MSLVRAAANQWHRQSNSRQMYFACSAAYGAFVGGLYGLNWGENVCRKRHAPMLILPTLIIPVVGGMCAGAIVGPFAVPIAFAISAKHLLEDCFSQE